MIENEIYLERVQFKLNERTKVFMQIRDEMFSAW